MKKIICILVLAFVLTGLSTSVKRPYPYVKYWFNDPDCTEYSDNKCYALTTIGGYPLSFLPVEPDTSFDDFGNDLFIGKNFLIDFVFYLVALSTIYVIYLSTKRFIK